MAMLELRHIFEAFSCLSDAQEVLETDSKAALERIDHAKCHLKVLLDSDPGALVHAFRFMPLECSLTVGDE